MLRGVFGAALKSTVCTVKHGDCGRCILSSQCFYFSMFETEIQNDGLWFLDGVKKVPHPFIIKPIEPQKNFYRKGETFDVELTIFKNYVNRLPYFIMAFIKLGEKGVTAKRHKLDLLKVFSKTNRGVKEIFDISSYEINPDIDPYVLEFEKKSTEKIVLNFISPLRIQHNAKVLKNRDELTPEILLRAVYRRIYSVLKLFYGYNLDVGMNFSSEDISIDAGSLFYKNIYRFSNRQKTKMEFGGFLGNITLSGGSLEEHYPWISLASYLNIGKNTSFGYGEFKII
jgi:hypothetical protein